MTKIILDVSKINIEYNPRDGHPVIKLDCMPEIVNYSNSYLEHCEKTVYKLAPVISRARQLKKLKFSIEWDDENDKKNDK